MPSLIDPTQQPLDLAPRPSVIDTSGFAPVQPRFTDTVAAGFELYNPIVAAAVTFGGLRASGEFEQDFNPFELRDNTRPFNPFSNPMRFIEPGLEEFLPRFVGARNRQDLERIKNKVRRELDARRVLEDSGVGANLAAVGSAVLLDPITFVPVGGLLAKARVGTQAARSGSTVGRYAGQTAGVAFVSESASQGLLKSLQETRTDTEVALEVGGATLLGGLLGALAGAVTAPASKVIKAQKNLDNFVRGVDQTVDDVPVAGGQAAGSPPSSPPPGSGISRDGQLDLFNGELPMTPAALGRGSGSDESLIKNFLEALTKEDPGVGPSKDLILKRAPFYDSIARMLAPRLRLPASVSRTFRQIGVRLHEIPVDLVEKGTEVQVPLLGRVGGRLANRPVSAESLRRQLDTLMSRWVEERAQHLYVNYVRGSAEGGRLTRIADQVLGTVAAHARGKLNSAEFFEETTHRILTGENRRGIAEVDQLASLWKKEVTDPFARWLNEMGYLLKNKDGVVDPSYLAKIPDREAFITRGPEFVRRYADLLQEEAARAGKTLTREAAEKQSEAVVARVTHIPFGRILEEADSGPAFRGPLAQRMLDLPYERFADFMVRDFTKLASIYTRSIAGDAAFLHQFGGWRIRKALDPGREALVRDLREAPSATKAARILSDRDTEQIAVHGGQTLTGRLRRGFVPRQRDVLVRDLDKAPGRSGVVKAVREAGSEQEAAAVLKQRDDAIIDSVDGANGERLLFERASQAVDEELKAFTAKSKSPAAIKRMGRRLDADRKALGFMVNHVRGLSGIPDDPTAMSQRFFRIVRDYNVGRLGGLFPISVLAEVGMPAATKGLTNAFGTIFETTISGFKGIDISRQMARDMTGASELASHSLSARLMGVEDDVDVFATQARGTMGFAERVLATGEKAVKRGNTIAMFANGMTPIVQFTKDFSALSTMRFVARTAQKVEAGRKIGRADRRYLKSIGLDRDADLRAIRGQLERHADPDIEAPDWATNTMEWTDARATLMYRQAVLRGRDLDVLIGDVADSPIAIQMPIRRMAVQFLNFAFKSSQIVVTRSLQDPVSARTLLGLVYLTMGGITAEYLRNVAAGRDQPESIDQWVVRGLDRSGATGLAFNFAAAANFFTEGRVGYSPYTGKMYSFSSGMEALFGPSYGALSDLGFTAFDFATGEADANDLRTLRRLLYLNTFPGIRDALDVAEDAFIQNTDIRETRRPEFELR